MTPYLMIIIFLVPMALMCNTTTIASYSPFWSF